MKLLDKLKLLIAPKEMRELQKMKRDKVAKLPLFMAIEEERQSWDEGPATRVARLQRDKKLLGGNITARDILNALEFFGNKHD